MDWPRRLNKARALPVVLCVAVALSLSSCHPVDEGRRGPDETVALSLPEIDPAMTLLPPDQWSNFVISRGPVFRAEVPADLVDRVWSHLRARYDGRLGPIDTVTPALSTSHANVVLVDRYFDTADLRLLRQDAWLRLRTVRRAPDTEAPTNERSIVQLGGRLAGSDAGRRRIDFRVHVPRPGARRSFAHQVIGLVDQDQRRAFRHALDALGVTPERTYHVFTLRRRERRLDASQGGSRLGTIALVEISADKWWEQVDFRSLELTLDRAACAGADPAGRASIERLAGSFEEDLRATFPAVSVARSSDYRRTFQAFSGEFLVFWLALRISVPVEAVLGALLLIAATAGGVTLARS